jgi:hypothetical protein
MPNITDNIIMHYFGINFNSFTFIICYNRLYLFLIVISQKFADPISIIIIINNF